VLDLACGSGEKTSLLTEALGPAARLVGVDLLRSVPQYGPTLFVVGDAHSLPLRDACVDSAVCIAALGLFADQAMALRELRRVLKAGAAALVVTADYSWAQMIEWPDDLAMVLSSALSEPRRSNLFDAGVGQLMSSAGFADVRTRTFRLDGMPDPWRGELALLPWPAMRPLVAHTMSGADLARCDDVAARGEIELVERAIVVQASVAPGTGSGRTE